MLARGKELAWWPDFMRVRYENWVNGLIGDWNITRQRFFGVPFPVWYPIDDGRRHRLPVADPRRRGLAADRPHHRGAGRVRRVAAQPARRLRRRPRRDGHLGHVVAHPADRRAAGRTTPTCSSAPSRWTCGRRPTRSSAPGCSRSVVRSHYEHDCLPWANAAISGFVYDPDRKKLSKSAGNSPTSRWPLLEQHGADAVRYWAANGRPGMDIAFDEGQMKIGRRLAIKLLNASKFALGFGSRGGGDGHRAARPGDARRAGRTSSTRPPVAFDRFDYARALERTEALFWSFCDDYLELVKNRAYGDGRRRRVRRRLRSGSRSRRCSSCSRRSCPTSPKRCGRGGRRAASTAPPGPTATPLRAAAAGEATRSRCESRPTCSPRSAGPSPRPSGRCARRSSRVVVTDTAERLAALGARGRRRQAGRRRRRAGHRGRRRLRRRRSTLAPEE